MSGQCISRITQEHLHVDLSSFPSPHAVPHTCDLESNPLIEALLCTTVGDVRSRCEVKYLKYTDRVSKLMHELVRYKFLSYPVVDNDGEVLGVVDGADLIAFLQKQHPEKAVEAIRTTQVLHLIDISQSNPYLPVFTTTSLHGVISILAPGCHRTVVFESEESTNMYAIFSETDLIHALYKLLTASLELPERTLAKVREHWSSIQALARLPISEFAAHRSRPTTTARTTDSLSSAIAHVMHLRRLSDPGMSVGSPAPASEKGEKGPSLAIMTEPPRAAIVAVLDQEGRLVGHLGASDLNHSVYRSESVFAEVSQAFPASHQCEGEGRTSYECLTSPMASPKTPQYLPSSNDSDDESFYERAQSGVQMALSALQLTLQEYLSRYARDSLNPIIVRDSIPFKTLLKLLSDMHKHHVWVLEDDESLAKEEIKKEVMADGKSSPPPTDAPWVPYLVEGVVDCTKLQVLTLTDILRWVARDEIALVKDSTISHEGL